MVRHHSHRPAYCLRMLRALASMLRAEFRRVRLQVRLVPQLVFAVCLAIAYHAHVGRLFERLKPVSMTWL